MTQIPLITRMTTEYRPEEDRLRLLASLSDGRTEVLWLTQRLILRLVPALLEWLGEPDNKAAAGERNTGQADTSGASLAQPAEKQSVKKHPVKQQAAEPTVPVAVSADSAFWLVQKVDLQRQPDLIYLQFYGTGFGKDTSAGSGAAVTSQAAGISFTREPLLQWLGIVMSLAIDAGWPDTIWPQWLAAYIPGRIQGAPLH